MVELNCRDHQAGALGVSAAQRLFQNTSCVSQASYRGTQKIIMPLAAERPYTYLPLQGALDIRFVILQPGAFSSPIEINILHTSLARKRPYEALSYTWGDQRTLRPVTIQGRKRRFLYITENLEAALRHLRYPKAIRLLWIDALCINQSDLEERAFQVMRMGDIFSRAKNVCIWLGNSADCSDEALQFVDEVSHLEKLDKLVKDCESIKLWQALAALMKRPWFSRRWIIQEVAFARTATLYCGMKQSNWSDFSDAVILFGEKVNEINLLFGPPHRIDADGRKIMLDDVRQFAAHTLVKTLNYTIRKAADGMMTQRLCTMETLLSSTALLQATDPRDTVYALMTLAKDVVLPLRIPVSYKIPLRQVCKDLVDHTINVFETLDVICRPWAPISDDLPSWIPQISRHPFVASSDGKRTNADSLVGPPNRPVYNAGGKAPVKALFNDSGKGFILSVQGFLFDTITSIEMPAVNGKIPGRWVDVAMQVAEDNDETEISPHHSPEWSYIADTFWRILVANRGEDGSPPPGWYRRACELSYRRCDFENYEWGDLDTEKLLDEPLDDGYSSTIMSFLRRVQAVTWNRRLAVTDENYIGLVPPEAEEGDKICILFGCSVPVVLRENGDDTVEFIGGCYINDLDGVMDGHARERSRASMYQIVDWKLK